MSVLANVRHEIFCGLRAEGKTATAAYIEAGYSEGGARANASRLIANENIMARILEIRTEITDKTVEKAGLTETFIIDGLREIVETCSNPTSKAWHPQAAIRALELLGKKLGLWVVRVDERRRVDGGWSSEELDAVARELRHEIDDLEERRARLLEEAVA
ncbi:MAG: terminase small subunit [Alphaproteobacteria bacterium]|nr:terminase small subunit [Alphaproteobacteria bacterium]